MSTELTQHDIDILRFLLRQGTPGEWATHWQGGHTVVGSSDYGAVATTTPHRGIPTLSQVADAELIAYMHEALPALLDIAEDAIGR